MSEIRIQLHYDFYDNNSHLLDFYTRKYCSDAQVKILEAVIEILYPSMKYQVLSIPDQKGSFKDNTVVKFLNENQGTVVTATTVIGLVFAGVLFKGDFESNKTGSHLNTLEIVQKCRELNLDDTRISLIENEICNSYGIKSDKNSFYESVRDDEKVSGIRPKVSDGSAGVFFDNKIPKDKFNLYIEKIPKRKEFIKEDLFGHIELAQPFILKQQRYGRGTAWRGVYYGKDIIYDDSGSEVLVDGENVFFYMQDDEYKEQILSQEISFRSGDNIGVIFDIGRYYNYLSDAYGNPRLYVTRVTSHNDNLVHHKKELENRKKREKLEKQNKNQSSLFDLGDI